VECGLAPVNPSPCAARYGFLGAQDPRSDCSSGHPQRSERRGDREVHTSMGREGSWRAALGSRLPRARARRAARGASASPAVRAVRVRRLRLSFLHRQRHRSPRVHRVCGSEHTTRSPTDSNTATIPTCGTFSRFKILDTHAHATAASTRYADTRCTIYAAAALVCTRPYSATNEEAERGRTAHPRVA
jgi:hypothetical protein